MFPSSLYKTYTPRDLQNNSQGPMPVGGAATSGQEHKVAESMVSRMQGTTRDNKEQNTDKELTPSFRIEVKISDTVANEIRVAVLKGRYSID